MPASWLDSAPRRPLGGPADRSLGLRIVRCGDAAEEGAPGAPPHLLTRFLLPQRNSVDDRRKRLFTEREIQMLFRHRQRELRSPLQPLREI